MSLITKISNEDMVDISINMDKFTEIIRLLNQHQKEQDQKLYQLECKIEEMLRESQNSTFESDVTSKIESLETKLNDLEDEIHNVKSSCDQKIENSVNDIIVQQSVQNRNILEGFESRIHQLSDSVQEVKKSTEEIISKDIEDLNVRLKHLYSKVLKSQSNTDLENSSSISDLDNSNSKQGFNIEILKQELLDDIDQKFEQIKNLFIFPSPSSNENDTDATEMMSKSKYIELLTTTNYNKATIMQLASKLDELTKKVNSTSVPIIPQRTLDVTNKNKKSSTFDPEFETQQTLAGINGIISMINNKVAHQQQEINDLKANFTDNEQMTRPIFYALIDGLMLIHSHADGMEEIPVQNFQNVSPKYFMNDSDYNTNICKYCSRFPPKGSKSTEATHYVEDISSNSEEEEEDKEINNNQIENNEGSEKVNNIKILDDKNSDDELPSPPPPPSKKVKQISGLLHLVSCHTHSDGARSPAKNNALFQAQINSQIQSQVQAQVQAQLQALVELNAQQHKEEEAQPEPENEDEIESETTNRGLTHIVKDHGRTVINNFQNNKIEILGTTGRPKPVLSRTLNFVIVDMKIGDSMNTLNESEITTRTRELGFMLGQFKREKDELMSTIDRKVDRDFVERLFDKFRVLLNDMNEKVSKFQRGSDKFATINQIEEVFRMIENVKSSIINLISNSNNNYGDEAAAGKRSCTECLFCGRKISLVAGGISARSLGNYEESSQFVYGDGGVFKKANTISSIPNETKKTNLPPLKGGLS